MHPNKGSEKQGQTFFLDERRLFPIYLSLVMYQCCQQPLCLRFKELNRGTD